MTRYRSKPKYVHAVQITTGPAVGAPMSFSEEPDWLKAALAKPTMRLGALGAIYTRDGYLWVNTPSGPIHGDTGDWVVMLNPEDIYVVKEAVFPTLYEPADV